MLSECLQTCVRFFPTLLVGSCRYQPTRMSPIGQGSMVYDVMTKLFIGRESGALVARSSTLETV